jgi:hypothetical protein
MAVHEAEGDHGVCGDKAGATDELLKEGPGVDDDDEDGDDERAGRARGVAERDQAAQLVGAPENCVDVPGRAAMVSHPNDGFSSKSRR